MIAQGWLLAGAVALGVLVGATGQGWRLDAQHEVYKASVANDAAERAIAVRDALQAEQSKVADGEVAISKQRLENAKANEEVERLERCVRNGTCGLRVAAKCPAAGSVQQAPGDSTGRDSAGSARLTAAAESDYLEFRRKYAEQLKVLRICKAYGETQKPSN